MYLAKMVLKGINKNTHLLNFEIIINRLAIFCEIPHFLFQSNKNVDKQGKKKHH